LVSVAAFGLVTFSFLSVFLVIFLASSAAFAPVNFSFVSACCELTSLSISFFSGSSALVLDFLTEDFTFGKVFCDFTSVSVCF